jgi:hypothetical protein
MLSAITTDAHRTKAETKVFVYFVEERIDAFVVNLDVMDNNYNL